MHLSPLEQEIKNIVSPVLEDMGFKLVTVSLTGQSEAQNLIIMAEDPLTGQLGVDDCARISRSVSAVLDVADPISFSYRLEISSPGMDRPLVKLDDFVSHAGKYAKIETLVPMGEQKRFKGLIKDVLKDKSAVVLESESGDHKISFDNIKKAHLMITEDMIRQDLKKAKQ